MKTFRIVYRFSSVIEYTEAKNKKEAEQIAWDKLESDYNPINDTECYEIEVEEN